MKLSDHIKFRRDLLFQGAVQVGWFESDPERTKMAAEHFVFHGPKYHGLSKSDNGDGNAYRLLDTATFVRNVLVHVADNRPKDDPITLAVAGYGTGKSHLALTLAKLLSEPNTEVSKRVINNITSADQKIGNEVSFLLSNLEQPYLIITINGMEDFELAGEIVRQVYSRLSAKNIDTAPLEALRPRFLKAQIFTESFFDALQIEFIKRFGAKVTKEEIIARLKHQDEEAFIAVNRIFELKMGDSLRAVAHESLQGFLKVVRDKYCGINKPFAGVLIFFDEFGRYLEFAVSKPHIAGAGGLQQLFEAVQENSDAILLLSFIQYELKAYASRIAPEARDALERFISRYDLARKVRLSTNLETIIANLIEKKDAKKIQTHVDHLTKDQAPRALIHKMKRWFPQIQHHALWSDEERFHQVIQRGCWPLHPCSTWLLYWLSSAGKSLQQRSALSFLDDLCERFEDEEVSYRGWVIPAVELCSPEMIQEFRATERYGQHGTLAQAYESALLRYGDELSELERKHLKAVLLASRMGLRARVPIEFQEALSMLVGMPTDTTQRQIAKLSKERGLLRWNENASQYDIISDAVSVADFHEFMKARVKAVGLNRRSQIFAHNLKSWCNLDVVETDFGPSNKIDSSEWHYIARFCDISTIEANIKLALHEWKIAYGVNEKRGQLIYCYVGPESNVSQFKEKVIEIIDNYLTDANKIGKYGAPIAVTIIYDKDGLLGERLAEYWVACEQMEADEGRRYTNYIRDHKKNLQIEIMNTFRDLEKKYDMVFTCNKRITGKRLKDILSNLFDKVYPERIEFPFDGFHTAHGNAAKDCRLFITELFAGNLSQSWIAARKSQQKNRAVTVLQQSWQIFDPNGSVRSKPGHEGLRSIIEWIENKNQKNDINFGEVLSALCKPPYGCNIASAGLILGVFVAARKERVRLRLNDEPILIEEWLSKAFNKEFFDIKILEQTLCEFISGDRMHKWESLLNDWDVEKTYEGQVEYIEKAKKLGKEEPISEGLYYRWMLLQERSLEAQERLNVFLETIRNQDGIIEKCVERQEAGRLARCCVDLDHLMKEMDQKKWAWTSKQHRMTQGLRSLAMEKTKEFFPAWIKKQVITDPTELSAFKNKMSAMRQTLASIGLEAEARQVYAHVDFVASEIDGMIRNKFIVEQVNGFVKTHPLPVGARVIEIRSCLEAIPALRRDLEGAVGKLPVPQLNDALGRLNDLERQCIQHLQAYSERKNNIQVKKLTSIGELKETIREIRSLGSLYEGVEPESGEFRRGLKVLSAIERGYNQLDSVDLTDEQLDEMLQVLIRETISLLDDDELQIWNVDEIYRSFLVDIEAKRRGFALAWIKTNVPSIKDIKDMDASLVQRLRAVLEAPPAALNSVERRSVYETLNACLSRLDGLEVEGLLVRFNDLSQVAKLEFLSKAQEILKS